MIETKTVTDRRSLTFHTMEDIAADVDALDAAGARHTSGNWTDAQVVAHVTTFITGSLDGFDLTAPWLVRFVLRLSRGKVLRSPIKPGFKLPDAMKAFVPDPGVTWEDAIAGFRREMDRIRGGERMSAPSPVFGRLSHEQWEMLHCRHAELHFSFVQPA